MASTGLIILASEQLWPNIYSIVHELESLQVLCVYCTDDDSRSIKPAQRLEQLCQESFPKLQVDLKIPPPGIKGIYPQEVRQQIHDWQAAYSVERWLLNATGGPGQSHARP